jgi:V/A-type H+/Na+-transporting ATPase subunit D
VHKDRTVSLHGVVYEVDAALVGEKVTLRFDPAAPPGRPVEVWHAQGRLAEAIRLRVEAEIARERLALLEAAVVKITQRVNLFEKVLVPQTLNNIRRINVFLGDAERSAVVGAKLAKRKREAQVEA